MVDKYAVKDYVANIIGEEHIIPTLGVWNRFDEIDFEQLPNKFVLKCTHDSGGLVICHDKNKLDRKTAKRKRTAVCKKSRNGTIACFAGSTEECKGPDPPMAKKNRTTGRTKKHSNDFRKKECGIIKAFPQK